MTIERGHMVYLNDDENAATVKFLEYMNKSMQDFWEKQGEIRPEVYIVGVELFYQAFRLMVSAKGWLDGKEKTTKDEIEH